MRVMALLTAKGAGHTERQNAGRFRRVMANLLIAIAFMGLLGTVRAKPAFAHASVSATSPEAGSTVTQSPRAVTITFDQGISVPAGGVRILNEKAERIGVQKPLVGSRAGQANTVSVSVPTLPSGAYVVSWRAVSEDGHPIRGAFTFRVGATGDQVAVARLARELLTNGKTDPALSALMALARALSFASMLLLLGAGPYLLFVRSTASGNDRRVSRLLIAATVVGAISGLVTILSFGPYVAGEGFGGVADGTLLDDTLASSIGRSMLFRTIALVALGFVVVRILSALSEETATAPTQPAPHHRICTRTEQAALVGLSTVMLGLSTLVGHGTTGRWGLLGALATACHIAAASAWIGVLVLVVVATSGTGRVKRQSRAEANKEANKEVRPFPATRSAPTAEQVLCLVERFSTLAFWSVAVLMLSGMLNGFRQVGSVEGLRSTNYGRLLLIKLGVVALLVGLGWLSRRSLAQRRAAIAERSGQSGNFGNSERTSPEPSLTSNPLSTQGPTAKPLPPALVRIRRRMLVESFAAALAVAVTALLVNSPPSIEVLGRPVTVTMRGTTFLLDTTVSPAQSGTNRLHFYALTPDGQTQTVEAMTVTASMPASDIAPIDLNVVRAGPNHFQALRADLPVKGPWRFIVEVQLDTFTAESVATTITIR